MFTVGHVIGFGVWSLACFALGYYICHRGLSKALADVKQAASDAKATVQSASKS